VFTTALGTNGSLAPSSAINTFQVTGSPVGQIGEVPEPPGLIHAFFGVLAGLLMASRRLLRRDKMGNKPGVRPGPSPWRSTAGSLGLASRRAGRNGSQRLWALADRIGRWLRARRPSSARSGGGPARQAGRHRTAS
jgi:hypothetical protein